MSIESIRQRLQDRQVKAGARGTDELTVCLDVALVEELQELEHQLAVLDVPAPVPAPGKARLGGTPPPQEEDTAPEEDGLDDLRAEIDAKKAEVRESSLRLVFRSLSSVGYQQLLNAHPEANSDEADQTAFFNDLASACLHEVWEYTDGAEVKTQGLSWAEIAEALSYGEWETATLKAMTLNRRKVDLPFSLKRSATKRT